MRVLIGLVALGAAITSAKAVAQASYDIYSDSLGTTDIILLIPDVRARRTIAAGESILDTRNARLAPGARLLAPASSPPKVSNVFSALVGDELFEVSSKNVAFKACLVKLGSSGLAPCLLDDDGDLRFDRASSNDLLKGHPLPQPIAYERAQVTLPPVSSGFRKSLIYQGATSETLRISYREFSDDLARPAFTEDLSVPLSKDFPQKIAIKGSVLTLYSITGMGLEYQIENADRF